MKIKSMYLFLFLMISTGCKDRKEIKIITPLDGAEVEHCCFDFEWETKKSKLGYEFQLSSDEDFETILIDTLITQTNFINSSILFPGTSYFWKVKSLSSETEVKGEFLVRDYIAEFEGSYEALVTIEDWSFAGTLWDTSFIGKLTIEKQSNTRLGYVEEKTGIALQCIYNTELRREENIIPFSFQFPFADSGGCSFDTSVDSIYAGRCQCGLGGGRRYTFKAKKE